MLRRYTAPDFRNVALIACCSKKLDRSAPARELYQSPLFRKSLAAAELMQRYGWIDYIRILSAKHGLVTLDQRLAPYDETLNTMPAEERESWALRVLRALEQIYYLDRTHFIFFAGQKYRRHLSKILYSSAPLESLGIGEQLAWLTRALEARRCRQCGCTDYDCSECVERTGLPCHWVEEDLCSACVEETLQNPDQALPALS